MHKLVPVNYQSIALQANNDFTLEEDEQQQSRPGEKSSSSLQKKPRSNWHYVLQIITKSI